MHAYEKIRAEMLRRITSQAWPAGKTLPHEEQLAEEFGVARGTMRRALSDLVERGLIERKRRAGTKVASRSAHSSILTIPIVRNEITATGAQYGYKLLTSVCGESELDPTGYFPRTKLLRISSLHLADGQPYQLEERLISLEAVPQAASADFGEVSPNEWLIEQVPYSAVRTVLRAESADQFQARNLKINRDSPVFVIDRQTRLDTMPVTLVKLSHRADTFSVATTTDFLR